MGHTAKEIAEAIGARLEGDPNVVVHQLCEPRDAKQGDLALAMKPEYSEALMNSQATAAVVWEGADWKSFGLDAAIFVGRSRLAMSIITQLFEKNKSKAPGIHGSAIVAKTAVIGVGVHIGPFVVVGENCIIGDNTVLEAHVTLEDRSQVGTDSWIASKAFIGHDCHLGERAIIHPGVVIGGDGFSFVTEKRSAAEEVRETLGSGDIAKGDQSWNRIHSLGAVEIGDDVEIGANSCVDRGTIRSTRIGRGTKIDNLVQVGHNVVIGEDCLLCGQAGVAGSSTIGDRVVLGGKVGVVDNIFVGDDVIAGAGTLVMSNVPSGRAILGYPAVKMDQQIEMQKSLRRLPRIWPKISKIK